jgi:hypothetical protein
MKMEPRTRKYTDGHNQVKREQWKGAGHNQVKREQWKGTPEAPENCTTNFVSSASRF